jgi:hypothetical protein
MPTLLPESASKENTVNTESLYHLPRFKCNNIIDSNNIEDAKRAYKDLYTVYYEKNSNLKIDDNFIPNLSNHCAAEVGCPYNPSLFSSGNKPNILFSSEIAPNTYNGLYVRDLASYLDDCGARIRNYDNNANNQPKSYTEDLSYANNLHDISYVQLVKTRNNLDYQVNEILANNKNSILYEKQNELDASVYSTLLWTVMITSLIYYVFTKI